MTRKKVKLAFIANDAARKATFKKRRKGLIKKVSELSTLCGIEACAIIYSPYETQPEVWPSPVGVQRVLSQFRQMPEMEQSKKMVNQESFLRQRIAKAGEQLKKQRRDNREKEVTHAMYQCLMGKSLANLTMLDLSDLGWLIDQNIKEIERRVETLKNGGEGGESSTPPKPPANLEAPSAGTSSGEASPKGVKHETPILQQQQMADHRQRSGFEANVENMQRQNWLVDFMNPLAPLPPPPPPPHQEAMGLGGEEMMMMPFGDNNNNNALWPNGLFP
ncbi:Agamous-like MADS-box protein agl80 [Turnera subulata]|uniref:Agamous-like MADS-box protein agl80 n=2 Tax=Turnera subulata TaxID=218843 RepID=A0A9Q0FV92_9ROSI|nr:Agamous-like MADS-box protein agl80 [Turnera subulata]